MLETIDVAAILRRALSQGGDFADVYYEDTSFTSIAREDGKVERVLAAVDRGIGLRVISEFCTSYAYTNQLNFESLLLLADTVSRGVRGGSFQGEINLCARERGAGFPIAIPPDQIALAEKVALVNRADRAARGLDRRIRQVMAV